MESPATKLWMDDASAEPSNSILYVQRRTGDHLPVDLKCEEVAIGRLHGSGDGLHKTGRCLALGIEPWRGLLHIDGTFWNRKLFDPLIKRANEEIDFLHEKRLKLVDANRVLGYAMGNVGLCHGRQLELEAVASVFVMRPKGLPCGFVKVTIDADCRSLG